MLDELGANHTRNNGIGFLLWAPRRKNVELQVLSPVETRIAMSSTEGGYFEAVVADPGGDIRYRYVLDGAMERPDPASRYQPEGVHGPSQTLRQDAFPWTDGDWGNIPLEEYILYELHVGTFTEEGTFDGVRRMIPYLAELGVNAVELMPVSQFPGTRNWGYDGTFPFAVQESYGGPAGLKRLVNECHRNGLAVVLDVVYNHLGPEGNYLQDFGPYFTDRYRTPWGAAVNFDGPGSDHVRRFFIESALFWIRHFHIDALRIDAVHGIFDTSATHFLEELRDAVQAHAERPVYLIPESDLNDVRIINPRKAGGYAHDAQWNDDFHHALHTLLTRESGGYYQDFGHIRHLAKALREGFIYSGQYSPFRDRRHGSSSAHLDPGKFVVFSQNHDQVGNRVRGDRLAGSLTLEQLKLAAACVLLSPSIPLLFMGEEYGEAAPFQYFVSHSDEAIIRAVREGRRQEFSSFGWMDGVPDPQDEATFLRSKVTPELRHEGDHRSLFQFYRNIIRLRRSLPALGAPKQEDRRVTCHEEEETVTITIGGRGERIVCTACFHGQPVEIPFPEADPESFRAVLDSSEHEAAGAGPTTAPAAVPPPGATITLRPWSFGLFREEAG
jgi:maltooligosyltrehalose trehalohydrolase